MAKKKTIDGQTTENLTNTKVNKTEKVETKATKKESKKVEEKPKVKKRIRDFTVKEKKKGKGYCIDTFYEF